MIFYVLVNEGMSGFVKIGQTSDLQQRMKELYSTGVPFPFICKYAVRVDDNDAKNYEKLIHNGLREMRVNPKREFFEVSSDCAVSLLQMIRGEDVTPKDESENFDLDELEAVEKHKKRRPPFRFSHVRINKGETLTFSKDDSITAEVISDRQIKFEDTETSLSASAHKILERMGYRPVATPGPDYWRYKDESLSERRRQN